MNRREFLIGSAALAALPTFGAAPRPHDPSWWLMLSDTHIQVPKAGDEGSSDALEILTRVVKSIVDREVLPANILFCGDNTQNGSLEQVKLFRETIAPLEAAGINCHILSGNHDKYSGVFTRAYEKEVDVSPVPGRIVKTLKLPNYDIICLDTSDETLHDCFWGRLEGEQLKWLQRQIREHKEAKRPYYLCAHHPINMMPMPKGVDWFESASGWICGHIHTFRQKVNVFGKTDQFGFIDQSIPSTKNKEECYVDMRADANQLKFKLLTVDGKEACPGRETYIKRKAI